MAISSPFYRAPQRGDWQSSMERARGPLYRDADPGMVVEPLADPGNVTPSTQYPTQPQQNAMEMQDLWRVGGGARNELMQPGMLGAYQAQQRNALLPAPQQLMPGNIDVHARPVVTNSDGSISTVRSMTITDENGRAILIPTIIQGRGAVSPEEAIRYYEQTGEHLGMFNNTDAADTYAQRLHEQQAQEYRR